MLPMTTLSNKKPLLIPLRAWNGAFFVAFVDFLLVSASALKR